MLSCALSFTTSSFLTLNNLSPRDWSGIDNRNSNSFRLTDIAKLKNALWGGIICQRDMQDLYTRMPEWDLDVLSDYWGVRPYNNLDWLTFSPVPFHATWQWISKLNLSTNAKSLHGVTSFDFNNKYYPAIRITTQTNTTPTPFVQSTFIVNIQ